jgi:hypothetical protein
MVVGNQLHASAALPPPQGKSKWYPLDRRPGEPQSRSGRWRKSHVFTGNRTPVVQPVDLHYVHWAILALVMSTFLSTHSKRHVRNMHHKLQTKWVWRVLPSLLRNSPATQAYTTINQETQVGSPGKKPIGQRTGWSGMDMVPKRKSPLAPGISTVCLANSHFLSQLNYTSSL